jgi:hypothetical protein
MRDWEYRQTLRHSLEEFAKLVRQRKAIDERLVRLSKTITSLRSLLGEKSKGSGRLKFTNACRFILRGYKTARTPVDIRKDLTDIGFPVEEYGNILASIHTILKRLVAQGEVRAVTVEGKTCYIATSKLQPGSGFDLYW